MDDGNGKTSGFLYIILVILIIGVAVLLLLPENNNSGGNNQGGNNNNGGTNPGGQIVNPGGTNPGGTNPGGSGTQDQPSTLILTLKGEQTIKIQKGEKYVEPGYTATDSIEGDLTSKVTTKGKVDNTKAGSYYIIYNVQNSKGEVKEAIRIVTVSFDASDAKIKISYTPEKLTNKDVTVTLKVTGEGYDYTTLPDGKKEMKENITYKITKNGTYTFKIKRKDGKIVKKEVKITNIDKTKPTVTCKNTLLAMKTVVTVTAKDDSGIKEYNYTIDSKKYTSNDASYTLEGNHKSVSVTVYDNASNYTIASCINKDYIWPVFEKQSFVATTPKHYSQNLKYNKLNYILYYPNDMDLKKQKNPLVVFLHGAGECGTYIGEVANNTTFGQNMRDGKFKGAVFLAPQCNCEDRVWGPCYNDLKGLINQVIKTHNIDTKRISLTGHSNGGAAIYSLLEKYSKSFSAVVLVAPSMGTKAYNRMKSTPIVVMTGTKDDRFYDYSRSVANTLAQNGATIKFYSLEGAGHGSQSPAYNGTNAIEWMINQVSDQGWTG